MHASYVHDNTRAYDTQKLPTLFVVVMHEYNVMYVSLLRINFPTKHKS